MPAGDLAQARDQPAARFGALDDALPALRGRLARRAARGREVRERLERLARDDVAAARGVLEPVAVEDHDATARVRDEVPALQLAGRGGHAAAAHAEQV